MNKLRKLAYVVLIGFKLIIIILQLSSIYISFKLRLRLIRWRSTRKFKKTLRRNDLPQDLIKELDLLYTKELKKKLKFSIMRLRIAR